MFASSIIIDDEAFECKSCGDSPNIVLCDGTLLACRKDYVVETEVSCEQSRKMGRILKTKLVEDRVVKKYTSRRTLLGSLLEGR